MARRIRIPLTELIKMYSFKITRSLDKGVSTETESLQLSTKEIYDNFSSIVTQEYVTRLYHLTDTPRIMKQAVSRVLRECAPRELLIDIVTEVVDAPLDWTSPYMKRLKDAWNKEIAKNKPRLNKSDLNNKDDYDKARKSNSAIESWNLIAEETSKGHRTCDTEIVVLCRYPRGMKYKDQFILEQRWLTSCAQKGFKVRRVDDEIKPLLYDLSPYKVQGTQPIKNYSTWTEKNIALSQEYSSGKLDGTQLFLGIDVRTNMFVFSDLLNTKGGALNMMILADTGTGKSFYTKFIIPMLLVPRANVIIWDKDGEYSDLANKMGYPTVALGKSGGLYFNTIPIIENDEDGYVMSRADTIGTFNVLCDPDNGMTSQEESLLQKAYTDMMQNSGVSQYDSTTWRNSYELDFMDMYKSVVNLQKVDIDLKSSHTELCRKLYQFFGEDGINNTLFIKSINMRDFLHYKSNGQPLLVCINMQLGTEKLQDRSYRIQAKLKSLTLNNITDRLVAHYKKNKELVAVIIDEFQRQLTNKPLVTKVHEIITGGRKENMIPIIILNSINSMVESDNPLLRDILNNINTMIVGAVKEEQRILLAKYADIKYCEAILDKIYMASTVTTGSTEQWSNSFLVKIKSKERTELAVVKALVPRNLRETIFKTRDDLDESKKKDNSD